MARQLLKTETHPHGTGICRALGRWPREAQEEKVLEGG